MLKCCFGSAPSSPGEALSPTANQTPDSLGHVTAVPVETVGLHPQAGPGATGNPVVQGGPSPVTEAAAAASDINSIRLSELRPSGQVNPSLHDSSRPSQPSASQQPCSAVLPPWLSTPSNFVPAAWALEETSMPPPDSGENTISATADITHNTVSEILRAHLSEVKLVLQKLSSLNTIPSIALNEAVDLLCKHLGVSMCSITGLTDHCTTFVLLAAYGAGAAELEKIPVMRGMQWSASQSLEQPTALHYTVRSMEELASLPPDFLILHNAGNLCSFMSVPISTDSEVIGILTIAKEDCEGFDIDRWEPLLGCVGVGLLPYLRSEQTQALCQLSKALDLSPEYTSLIHTLLRGAHSLLLRATNIHTGCRLALLGSDPASALIFEPDQTVPFDFHESVTSGGANGGGGGAGAGGAGSGSHLRVTEIQLENTLLSDAVQKGKARFVSDCASYIQSCMKPATDIFISGQEMVASIVVLPLIYEGVTFGGFYVTLEVTSNFQNIKDLLMGFINSVVLVLSLKLQPQREMIWEAVTSRAEDGTPSRLATDQSLDTGVSESGSIVPKPQVVKRSCTQAMLKVLQHELRKTHAKSQQVEWIEELSLQEIVGKGGFGVVYKGSWKGSVAAVKVMYARQHERQAMKDALEMAVLTTVSHPNIIQVYDCFTDMVEDASGTLQPTQEGKINVRFRRLQPDEDSSLATCNILVMEYCDKVSLRHAMKKGVFHKRLGNTSVAVDLCAIVKVLIEVAQAVQHLHLLKLIHCDIKPENVLLKSDGGKGMGFVTKLSDFGLAKLLRENYYIVNRSGSGTVTHLAPELFQVGSKLTIAVDAFSFGIMMWELYSGQRAYGGLGRDAIIDRVYKKKARPIFPLGVPPAYAALAKACWDNEPGARPLFGVILSRLSDMMVSFRGNSGGPETGGSGAEPT
ncbi:MAG: hypothetical protein WDW38_003003 [Sanguina aurantia]